MRGRRRSLALAIVTCAGLGALAPPKAFAGRGVAAARVAFVHPSVVPMDRERVLHDHTVIVEEGRILEVGPTSRVRMPADTRRIDARGRHLIPALCDMHVHLLGPAWAMMLTPEVRAASQAIPQEDFLFPYLANGVTTVMALSATPEEIAMRERIEAGTLLGPRLVLARMIDGPDRAWPPPISTWVATPGEAREAVRRARREGYDKIKAYSFLSRESYDALIETARELGMEVIGHVPMALTVGDVAEAGQRLVAHSEELAKHADGRYDAAVVDAYADTLATHDMWMIPTLVTTESILEIFDDPGKLVGRAEAAYFRHPMEAGVWSFILEKLYLPIPAPARTRLRDDYEKFQRPLTKSFQQRSGRILAGSDSPLPGLVPGFALHRELRELVAAGLTPYEALRAATTAPYEYLGEIERSGTIEAGKRTDLVLVEANPLEDVAAASRIAGVLVRGRWLGAEEIRRRMQGLAAGARVAGRPATARP